MKILAGIITYNPDVVRLEENIKSILYQVDKVIIVDNGSSNIEDISVLTNKYSIVLKELKENKGIAVALNKIGKYAIKNKYEWFLTLDQDSIASSKLIKNMKKHLEIEKLALVMPTIIDRNFREETSLGNNEFKFVKNGITSGTLNCTKIYGIINGFDEKMFIDKVDFDYNRRIIESGFRIIKIGYEGLLHEVGEAHTFKIFNKQIFLYNHSPIRRYYSVRNGIYLSRKFRDSTYIIDDMIDIFKILIFERHRKKKFVASIKGITDGIRMRVDNKNLNE